jgi:hypothetical protein
VGWVALAPFEVVHPWWGRGFYGGFNSGVYGNHTTIINNANLASSYRNARVTGGVMGTNTAAFGRGGQVTALNRSQIQSAGVVHGVLPVAPDRASLRMSNRAVNGRYPQTSSRTFASRMQTPRVEHASFTQQQRGMQQMSRGSFSEPAGRGTFGGGGLGNRGASESHGWSRFGEPIHGTAGAYSRSYSGSASGGVQRYNYARPGSGVRVNPAIVARPNTAPRSSSSGSRGLSGGARPSGGGGHASSGGHGGHR